jgi:hypothetical protein
MSGFIAFWLETEHQRYLVEVDRERNLLSAQIHVHAHDKAPTLRRVVNAVTLERLQKLVRPRKNPDTRVGVGGSVEAE